MENHVPCHLAGDADGLPSIWANYSKKIVGMLAVTELEISSFPPIYGQAGR